MPSFHSSSLGSSTGPGGRTVGTEIRSLRPAYGSGGGGGLGGGGLTTWASPSPGNIGIGAVADFGPQAAPRVSAAAPRAVVTRSVRMFIGPWEG